MRGRRKGGDKRRFKESGAAQRVENWVPRTRLGKMVQEAIDLYLKQIDNIKKRA